MFKFVAVRMLLVSLLLAMGTYGLADVFGMGADHALTLSCVVLAMVISVMAYAEMASITHAEMVADAVLTALHGAEFSLTEVTEPDEGEDEEEYEEEYEKTDDHDEYALPAEIAKKIDTFLDDPSTGTTRTRPQRGPEDGKGSI